MQVDRVVGGPKGCSGLSDLGRRQVDALRQRLERVPVDVDVLLSSTLPRAIETAELIAPALGVGAFDRHDDLCELFPGESDALTWEEFGARYRPPGWTFDPHEPMAPGAESWVAFQARVARALQRITEEHEGKTIVVACHGGVVDGSLVHFLELPATGPRRWRVTNSSVTEWVQAGEAWDSEPAPAWRLDRFNDAAHLEELETPEP